VSGSIALLLFVTLQRGLELAWARANENRLRRQGAIEVGAAHYPLIVMLHASWLAWLWWRGFDQALVWPAVAAFFVLQGLRAWILATLGRRWTARVLVVPGETLVRSGPFRFIKHPNYTVVALELPMLPLAFGLWGTAIVFGLLNLAMLAWRIRVENRALASVAPAAPLP